MSKPRNKQIYEEASEWVVELRVGDVDAAKRERLDAWFRTSPEHIRAYLELSSIWEEGGDPDLHPAHSAEALVRQARTATNVIALEEGAHAAPVGARAPGRARGSSLRAAFASLFSLPRVALAGAGIACLAVALSSLYVFLDPTYATGTGEQRTVHLRDGSTVELNSGSRIRILFSPRERDVELLEGQALFQVAKDATRPFVVKSDSARVRAVGTQFDVYRKTTGITVTVLEGRVAVYSQTPAAGHDDLAPGGVADSPSASILTPDVASQSQTSVAHPGGSAAVFVSPGERVIVTRHVVSAPQRADVTAATAWTQQELVFDSTALIEVAQEFNRYNRRKLVVLDPGLAHFHVTGIFSSTDPRSLILFLRKQRGIAVEETDQEIRISRQ